MQSCSQGIRTAPNNTEYRSSSEIAAELRNINTEYNRSGKPSLFAFLFLLMI